MRAKIAFLILGLAFLGIGLYLYEQPDVRCGGVAMHQGDSCQVTNNGNSKMLSYDEERNAGRNTNIIYIVVGGLMTAAAVGMIVKGRIDGRNAAGTPAAAFFGRPAEPTPPPAATDQVITGH